MKRTRPAGMALRLLLVAAGILLLGVSIACMLWASVGSDPTTVCVEGISGRTGLSYGVASTLVNTGLLAVLLLVNRKKIHLATVASALGIGPAINLFNGLLFAGRPGPGLAAAVAVCVGAVALNSLGLSVYLSADLGASAFDGLILTIHDRLGLSYRTAMFLFYLVLFAAGVLLGGTWGIGTLLSLVLGSYLFDKTYPALQSWAGRLLR